MATGPAFSPFNDPSQIGVLGWLITKYDVFNRPVYTGWEQSTTLTNAGRLSKQNSINGLTTINETKQSSGTIDGIIANYSNTVLPTTFKLLTVNYYDDYNFPNAPTFPAYGYNGVSSFYNNSTMKPKGMPTGSWARVITASSTLQGDASYVLYDNKARPIRNYTANYMGGFTQTDTDFDFSGKTTHTNTSHKRVSTDPLIWLDEYFTYSPQDRLLTHTHKVWTGMVQLLAENTYDELGQLISKNVGNTTAASLQKVDYAYNIRGWLTDINNTANLIQGSDPKDLFAFKINYNAITGTIAGVKLLYNGNISETYWRNNSDNTLRKYGYEYDNLNRLKNATFQTPLPDGTSPGLNFYQEQMSYDKNGNIMNLYRTQKSDSGGSYILPIDNLTYFYGASNATNQLTKVSDITNRPEGFKDDSDGYNDIADDYTYDLNGNLKTDANKNITAITYNHLNLPTKITFGTTGNITYIYNANGQKVQKQVFLTTQGGVPVVNYYLNGFQYIFHENYSDYITKLQFVPTSEGYYDFIKGKYVFNYTDHLGNIRLSYAKNPTTNVLEILEESNYYPFGLKHSPSAVVNAQTSYKYKFNGMEESQELGLNWLHPTKFRSYDPAIARFNGIDPLADKSNNISPYAFVMNNPILYSDLTGADTIKLREVVVYTKKQVNNAYNWFTGANVRYAGSGWGHGLRRSLSNQIGIGNRANNIFELGLQSQLQAKQVNLGGSLLDRIKEDEGMIKFQNDIIKTLKTDPRFKKLQFIMKGKGVVEFGGKRWSSSNEDWGALNNSNPILHGETWAVGENQLTWVTRHASMGYSATVKSDGTIVIDFQLNDTFDLSGQKGRSEAYNNISNTAGFLYHDVVGGNNEMEINANWQIENKN